MGNDKKDSDDKIYADENSKTSFTTESRHGDRRDSTPEEIEETIKEYDKNDRQGGNKGGSIGK